MEPTPPALEAWSPNHWTAREVSGEGLFLLPGAVVELLGQASSDSGLVCVSWGLAHIHRFLSPAIHPALHSAAVFPVGLLP